MRKLMMILITAASVALTILGSAHAQPILYGAAHQGPDGMSTLYTINPASGAATPVGPIGFERVSAMDYDAEGTLFATGERADGTDTLVLLTIDPETGVGTEVGVIGDHSFGDTIADISFRSDGTLYAYLESSDGLGTLDVGSGDLTELGPTNVRCCGNGIAFSPSDSLFHSNEDDLNGLNQATGQAVLLTAMVFSPPADDDPRINAMDFQAETGVLFASLNDGYADSAENYLATVDTVTGITSIIGPTVDGLDALAWKPELVFFDHLMCYEIERVKGREMKRREMKRKVVVENQFGEYVFILGKARLFCVPTAKTEVIGLKRKRRGHYDDDD
ncbi:hypothetical protein D1BOALGB6SA_4844 [Olavius sp. associated proteobacterium Delta 1]|nr:hypothetical protein D1BOALGB6SA_4844 [Olavius sp. associated proteobacterium Delta 1]